MSENIYPKSWAEAGAWLDAGELEELQGTLPDVWGRCVSIKSQCGFTYYRRKPAPPKAMDWYLLRQDVGPAFAYTPPLNPSFDLSKFIHVREVLPGEPAPEPAAYSRPAVWCSINGGSRTPKARRCKSCLRAERKRKAK